MNVLVHLRSPKVNPKTNRLCDFVYGEEDFPSIDPHFYEIGYNQRMLIPRVDIELVEKGVIYPKDDSNVWVVP